jgi:glucose/arabinose dehydrogenase
MEMPSVQVPVRGVLGDNVTDQLAAVWQTLNTPGFEPPEPNPIRVLRLSGVPERKESPIVLHDVVKDGERTYLFPLVIGLPNRHNILFDLETNRLAAWWLGDTARQRTKGKSWWWEMGAKPIWQADSRSSECVVVANGKEYSPVNDNGLTSILHLYERGRTEVKIRRSIRFTIPTDVKDAAPTSHTLALRELVRIPLSNWTSGFERTFAATGLTGAVQLRWRPFDKEDLPHVTHDKSTNAVTLTKERVRIECMLAPGATWTAEGAIEYTAPAELEPAPLVHDLFSLRFSTNLPTDRYVTEIPAGVAVEPTHLQIAPGFAAQRLPLDSGIMPTALAWRVADKLVFSTLQGEVFEATDSDGDMLYDQLRLLEDGVATPYGITTQRDRVLVLSKVGLSELWQLGDSGLAQRASTMATGWGVTDDYHDWAVGLVQSEQEAFFIGLPCQQDQRSDAQAKHRGQVIKLKRRKATPDDVRPYEIEVLSSGHRFPMGLAMNRAGDLFVTDNQGNYNPFNELNHVRPGKHFGFINANEKVNGYKPPPLEEPAINIPHPWTRSVNGICFLDTPVGWDKDAEHPQAHQDATKNGGPAAAAALSHPTKSAFGPLEGHLIGCEYDTRRLIRMTLQKIGDTYQGAAYPLSIPPDDVEKGLLGPIVCAVKPTTGELYVGEIRDSGWGAGNNVGQIVKIKIEPEKLPCGIAEMKATADGFTLDFFQPVDAKKAADIANYSLQSYRRESTPAYGGPDLDRRTEKIAAIEVSRDQKRVTLKLSELRERFLYELRLKNLAPKNAMFHPDEAHFTLRQVPR